MTTPERLNNEQKLEILEKALRCSTNIQSYETHFRAMKKLIEEKPKEN